VRTQERDWFKLEREMGLYLFREIDLNLKIDLSKRRHLSIERRGKWDVVMVYIYSL